MALNREQTAQIRERLYVLNPDQNPFHRLIYQKERYVYLKAGEGERCHVYKDGKRNIGKTTIGIGFNMDRAEARKEWERALNTISFEEVRGGKRNLTSEECKRLFHSSIAQREKELSQLYKDLWAYLKPNERLALEDIYFNCPALVRPKTRFYENLRKHGLSCAHTKDFSYLRHAVYELEERSNPLRDPGLQNRRNSQGELLATYKISLLS